MSTIRTFIKKWLLRRNMILSKPPGQFIITPFKLAAAKSRGLEIRFAIDGGAATGDFARELLELYPAAQILCVEPRDDAQPALAALVKQHPGVHIARSLIGDHEGTLDFYVHGAQSSTLKNSQGAEFGQHVVMPVTTLDALLEKMKLPQPDLIKLDLQGAELDCLRGAAKALAHAEAVLLEGSFIPFQDGQLLLADVIAFMKERGFRLYDILALWHRPLDGALAQGDFLFIREGSKLLTDSRWSADSAWS